MIVRLSVVLRRTFCDDIGWSFNNLSRSHYQSQGNCEPSIDVISLWLGTWLADEVVEPQLRLSLFLSSSCSWDGFINDAPRPLVTDRTPFYIPRIRLFYLRMAFKVLIFYGKGDSSALIFEGFRGSLQRRVTDQKAHLFNKMVDCLSHTTFFNRAFGHYTSSKYVI